MITRSQAFEMAAIYEQADARFRELLRDGQWHTLQEAQECLPPVLAETAYRQSGSLIDARQPDRLNFIRGMYGILLVRETAAWLASQGLCEYRNQGAVEIFHLPDILNGNADQVKLAGTTACGQARAKAENSRNRPSVHPGKQPAPVPTTTVSTRTTTAPAVIPECDENSKLKAGKRLARKPAVRSSNLNSKAIPPSVEELLGLDDLAFPIPINRAEPSKNAQSKKPTRKMK